eukprot:CAMPEP_0116010314 /NCGR_PEP_ID=MMETSP0321-20121206/3933_1 /TAXON_ID=163516 /ORGANISM="Leptocylindrus danicus var. danicus, Strain B650" /LENGTH=461 /DNA_ID=CAMNT_0003479401 /DNA_START=89 /DNA_END=1474 /DNA_ORIENTATION=-
MTLITTTTTAARQILFLQRSARRQRRLSTLACSSTALAAAGKSATRCKRNNDLLNASKATTACWVRTKATVPAHGQSTAKAAEASRTTASSTSIASTLSQSFLGIIAGVFTVGAAATIVEQSTAGSVPEFDPKGSRFSQDTFQGRFCKMLLGCDPRLLFYSEADVLRAKEMIDNYQEFLAAGKDTNIPMDIHRTLWEAYRISSAALHPDTGEFIPAPCRMSGYVPCNGPICAAMVVSSSTPSLLFWNWVNQSQNAGVNYFNRNASSPMTNETLIKSYAGAVGAALAVAFGLSTFVNRRYDPVRAKQVMRFVAFPSTVIASSLNCYIVRSNEIETGIPMLDVDGNSVNIPNNADGNSQIAAAKGVYSTVASRAILNVPVLFLPPFLLSNFPLCQRMIAKNPAMATPLTMFLLLTCFGIGLPAAVAIFPQIAEIKVEELEEKFHHLKDENGNDIRVLYYNKGL